MNSVNITLPSGLWIDGEHRRTALLRPLSGQDEAALLNTSTGMTPAQRTTMLLSRCVLALGPRASMPPQVDEMTVGDREALLLHLRKLSFGSRMESVLVCPNCGEKMDLELRADDLLLPPYEAPRQHYDVSFEVEGTRYDVTLRLPTGADQHAISSLDVEKAADDLLWRCLVRVTCNSEEAVTLPPEAINHIADAMSKLDPQAELQINLSCPACEHAFHVLLDMGHFLAQEVASRGRLLYREIHTLALYYHWSEADILGLPVSKRHLYLQLLSEALG